MVQVSSIVVGWVPQDSGRVASIQIQSRVSGSAQWTEEAAAFDATVGTFRFASNAPATDIDVRARYRMTSGVYGAWFSASIRSAGVAIKYTDVSGTPTKLADVNALEGGKLTGIAPGADVTGNNTSKDTNAVGGTPAATIVSNINSANSVANQAKIAADAAKAATDYQTGTVQPAVDQAIKANSDAIINERNRAVGKEGELKTQIDQIVANGSYDDTAVRALISDERKARADADSAFGERSTAIESSIRRGVDLGGEFGSVADLKNYWSGDLNTYNPVIANGNITVLTAFDNASCLMVSSKVETTIFSARSYAVDTSRHYRLSYRIGAYNESDPTAQASSVYVGIVGLDGQGNMVDHQPNGTFRYAGRQGQGVAHSGTMVTGEGIIYGEGNDTYSKFPPGTKQVKIVLILNYNYGAGTSNLRTYVDYVRFEDAEGNVNAKDAQARVGVVETAVTDGRFAAAQRASTLEAQMRGESGSNLLTRIAATELATTDGRFATAQRASTIEAQLRGDTASGLRARIEGTETAVTDGRFASAQSVSNLSAQIPSGLAADINNIKAVTSNGTFAAASSVQTIQSRIDDPTSGLAGLSGRVSTAQQTAVDAKNRTAAAYWTVGAEVGNNRAQLSVYATDRGGGVDIVGDTTFKGALDVRSATTGGRTEITSQGIRVFDSNNVLRAIMGFF